MGMINEFGKMVTNASQKTVRKTRDFADITKLNAGINEEQKLIDQNYSKIGELFFEKYSFLDVPDFKEYVDAVKDSKQKIELMNQQIQEIKREKECPRCGRTMADDSIFCPYCGITLEQYISEPAAPADKPIAPVEEPVASAMELTGAKQKAENPDNEDKPEPYTDSFVAEDTREMEKTKVIPNLRTLLGDKEEAGEEASAEAPQEEPKPVVCENCGQELDEDLLYCFACGHEVAQKEPERSIEAEREDDRAESGAEEFITCRNCGQKLLADAVFCVACGHKVQ